MWNLPKPDLADSMNDLQDIADHSRSFQDCHIPAIKKLYSEYDNNGGVVDIKLHDTISQNAQTALKDAYNKTSGSGIHANIRNEILNKIDKCPFCSIGNANSLDHFLEKADYKALSMMRQNLVPMCRDCNSQREYHKVKSSDFIHAYYDKLPDDKQWLKVKINYSGGAISASFYVDESVLTDPILLNKVKKTIQGIDFNSTVGKELHSFLSSTLSGPISSDDILKISIIDKVERHKKNPIFGLNHWKTVLLMELAANEKITRKDLSLYL